MATSKPSSESSINVDYHALKKAALVLRALNHKLRQQLLKLIEEEKNGSLVTTGLYRSVRHPLSKDQL